MRLLDEPQPTPIRRHRIFAAVLLTAAAIGLAGRSFTYSDLYQNQVYSRMPLQQLADAARRQPGNAIVLYYYGRALNAKGRFAEALGPLEHGAGLDPDSARMRGEWSMAQLAGGYITGAFGQLTQFVRTHPQSAEGHLALGRFYVAQNSNVRAAEELEQAVRSDPHMGDAWSLLTGARIQMGNLAGARDAARQAVALKPNSAVDHMMLASLALTASDTESARREYARAVTLAPNDPGCRCEYARMLLKAGTPADLGVAEQNAARAVALSPNSATAHYLLGRVLAQQGKYAAAVRSLQIAATVLPPGQARSSLAVNAPEQSLDPNSAHELARAYRALGEAPQAAIWDRMYLRRQQNIEEERRLRDMVRDHPEQKDSLRRLALFLARRGDVEGVAKSLGKALNSAPDAPKVLIAAANALASAGYGELAAPLAHRAALFSQNSPTAYESWGNALLAMDHAREASVKFAAAAGWWPEKLPIYRHKIAEYYRQRREHPSGAERLYLEALALEDANLGLPNNSDQVKMRIERAVALEPGNTDFRRTLLRILMRRHETEEAEQAARDLLAMSPEDGLSHAMLAILLMQKPDAEQHLAEAEAHLKAAQDEEDALPTVHYGQSVVAMHRRQPREAVRLLRQSIAEDPTADRTVYALAQAERMAGDAAAARKTMAIFSARVDRESQAVDAMKRIAERPDDRQRYVDAIQFYTRHGMKPQASAIQEAMRGRFEGDHSKRR